MHPSIHDQIRIFLGQILDPRLQKEAEKSLKQIEESEPEFLLDLIKFVGSQDVKDDIRLVGAIYFKNQIKSYWNDETSTRISAIEIRNCIKETLINLLTAPFQPPNVRTILSDVISHISYYDFPNLWPSLLPSLISKLSMENLDSTNTVLTCFNAIFKKYRHEMRSDELFLEIKHVLQVFAPVFTQVFAAYDSKWDSLIALPVNNERIKEAEMILNGLTLLCKIFYSLNFQDLPEYFEDEMKVFVYYFQKYLQSKMTFPSVLFQALSVNEFELGPIEKLRRSIIINVNLYALKYSEDFPYIDKFVPLIWNVISEAGQLPKFDAVVTVSMEFLETVAKQFSNKKYFEDPTVLKELVDKVIVSNILLRDCDTELFEDDPIEWLKRDVEGTSTGYSMRSAATSLIRGLFTFHHDALVPLLFEHVTNFVQINAEVAQSWRFKDAALFLFTAIAGFSSSSRLSVSNLNPIIRDKLDPFFLEYVLLDIQNPKDVHPLVIIDCVIFLITFRTHLSKCSVERALPLVIALLSHEDEGIRNACYIAIDKLFSYLPDKTYLIDASIIPSLIHQIVPTLLLNLNSQITSNNYQKLVSNEYLLKAFLRIIIVGKASVVNYFNSLLQILNQVLLQIIPNPSNPKFNHFVFEMISFLIKYCCINNAANYTFAEMQIFPTLQVILRDNIVDFYPYVFQLLSLLAYIAPIEQLTSSSSGFCQLLAFIMQPSAWSISANIPSLVKFLNSFIIRFPSFIAQNYINQTMGIIQILLKSKVNDLNGILLWNCAVQHIQPYSIINQYMRPITLMILNKLQSGVKNARAIRIATLAASNFVIFCKCDDQAAVDVWISLMESIQPGLSSSFVTGVILKDCQMLTNQDEKLMVFFTLVLLLSKLSEVTFDIVNGMSVLVKESSMLCQPLDSAIDAEEGDPLDVEEQEEAASTSSKMAATASLGSSLLYRFSATRKSQLVEMTRNALNETRTRQLITARLSANIKPEEVTAVQNLYSVFGLGL